MAAVGIHRVVTCATGAPGVLQEQNAGRKSLKTVRRGNPSTVPASPLSQRALHVCCAVKDDQVPSRPAAVEAVLCGLQSAGKAALAAAAAAIVTLGPAALPGAADVEFTTYYGTAASASSYGGYGGNSSKKDSAEYVFDVPSGWKERAISKVEKGTNGTDSEFFNPKKKTEKTYLTFLAGFRRLPPKDDVLNNIALSDVDLQDLLAAADETKFQEVTKDGKIYYDYEIDSYMGHALISVTAAKNKLYAHFVNAPPNEWTRDEAVLRQIHDSFRTVGIDPLGQY